MAPAASTQAPAWNHRLGWASLRLAALLGFAMLAPAALPAGGADRRVPEVRRREIGDPLISTGRCILHCAPDCKAPTLATLPSDSQFAWLRTWKGHGGQRWLQVMVVTSGQKRRGWVLG